MMRRVSRMWIGVWCALAAGGVLAQEPDLDAVCRELIQKGKDSYKDLGVAPQVSPVLTEKYKGKASDQVIRLLGKRHSSDSAIDAYVKLQLLTFEPDFKTASPDALEDMLKQLPALDRLPTPPGGLHQLEKLSWKQQLPKSGLEKATGHYNAGVGEIHTKNMRSLEYRKKLLQSLPAEGGYLLLGLLLNHLDVAAAGEEVPLKKHWDGAQNKTVIDEPTYDMPRAAEEAGKVGEMSNDMRRMALSALNKMRTIKGKYQSVPRTGVYEKDGSHHIWMHWEKTDNILGENDMYYEQVKSALSK